MAITYTKLFQPVALTNVTTQVAVIPAAPLSNLLMNGRVRATNTLAAAAVTLTIYVVPAAGAQGLSNALVYLKSIAANDYLDTDLPELAAGDAIWALSGSGGGITLHFMDGVIRS